MTPEETGTILGGSADDLAEFLRRLRGRRGLSVRGAARLAGLSHTSVLYWERGTYLPRVPELSTLLQALGATAGERREALGRLAAPRAVARLRQEAPPTAGLPAVAPGGGDLLRAMRHRRGWTLEQTAAGAGVRPSTLSRWEASGMRPSVTHLHALCLALGAHEQEVVALTLHWTRLDAFAEGEGRLPCRCDRAQEVLEAGLSAMAAAPEALGDLYKMALEAALLRLAPRDPDVPALLRQLYARSARALWDSSRVAEARAYAERVLLPVRAGSRPDWFWGSAVLVVAAATAHGRGSKGGAQAARYLAARAGFLDDRSMRVWALSETALHMAQAGEERALGVAEAACRASEAACREAGEGVWEVLFRRRERARVLSRLGHWGAALEALAGAEGLQDLNAHARVRHLLQEGECLLALGRADGARARLSEAEGLIERGGLSTLRRSADELAGRFEG